MRTRNLSLEPLRRDRAAGAIEQDIELAEMAGGAVNTVFYAVGISNVGLNEDRLAAGGAHLFLAAFAQIFLQLQNADLCALACKYMCCRAIPEPAPVIVATLPSSLPIEKPSPKNCLIH